MLPPHMALLTSLKPASKVSAAWSQQLANPSEVELDFSQPLHRMALLPPEGLKRLALWAGAASVAGDLRRVVLREEREDLERHLPQDVWPWIHQQEVPAPWPPSPKVSVSTLIEQVHTRGWGCLEILCDQLPRALGERMRLKLPLSTPTEPPAPQQVIDLLTRAYPGAVQSWDPSWEPQWQQALARGA